LPVQKLIDEVQRDWPDQSLIFVVDQATVEGHVRAEAQLLDAARKAARSLCRPRSFRPSPHETTLARPPASAAHISVLTGSRWRGEQPWPRDAAAEVIETNWLIILPPSTSHSFVFAMPAHKGLAFICGITELGQPRQAHLVSASRTNNFIVNAAVSTKNEGVALYCHGTHSTFRA
jgi:hypothetical protein